MQFCTLRAVGLDAKTHVLLIDVLINYACSFIYTTAFPFEHLVVVQVAHEFCTAADAQRARALTLVQYFRRRMRALLPSHSPIRGMVFRGDHEEVGAHVVMLEDTFRAGDARLEKAAK
ncbi:hypothetical protein PybrP1_010508 [[Pythium] brassicae (nom. inval.)]|nr:hypothetical protein PybrP1_010508 [[Pythium] brassicae (nom. inval.)]